MFSSPLLHAQTFNPDCKKCSSKHYFNTQHHSKSLPYWFCQIWMIWQGWHRDEPSPEMPEGTKYVGHCGTLILDMPAQSLTVPKNLLTTHRGMSTSPESWQMLQGVYLGFPTRSQFDIQLGDLKKSCCISQHLAESARKHRACQGENKTLMIEDRRR